MDQLTEEQQKICEENIKLVYFVASKFHTRLMDYDDIVGYGYLGLVNGVKIFKSNLEYKLSTYLVKCVKNEILNELRHLKEVLNIDDYEISIKSNICENLEYKETLNNVQNKLKHKEIIDYLSGEKTQTEIAKENGVSRQAISKRYLWERKILQKEFQR